MQRSGVDSQSSRPTYDTRGFRLGSLGCPCCGHLFPLQTNGATQSSRCAKCGIVVFPTPGMHESELMFTAAELRMQGATAEEVLRSGKDTEDQRATESAYCDKCKEMRKCFVFAQQTRGADEGQTIFFECPVCTNQWSLNS
jgi:DNA-directed RNA polymerase subunit M/transcription elongation factor TFIIS